MVLQQLHTSSVLKLHKAWTPYEVGRLDVGKSWPRAGDDLAQALPHQGQTNFSTSCTVMSDWRQINSSQMQQQRLEPLYIVVLNNAVCFTSKSILLRITYDVQLTQQ